MVNERIKELAEQADVEWLLEHHPKLEKFAELIVQECIKTVHKRFMGDLNREDMEVLRCVSELKNHFGIEE